MNGTSHLPDKFSSIIYVTPDSIKKHTHKLKTKMGRLSEALMHTSSLKHLDCSAAS
jgi:hypothetical protein